MAEEDSGVYLKVIFTLVLVQYLFPWDVDGSGSCRPNSDSSIWFKHSGACRIDLLKAVIADQGYKATGPQPMDG